MAVIRECVSCHFVKPHACHGLCGACYRRRYYRAHYAKPRGPRLVWNTERMRLLTSLFNADMRMSEIAKALGVTKNTVSGACWRNGLIRKNEDFVTTEQRLALLTAKLDSAMALPVKRVPNTKGAVSF